MSRPRHLGLTVLAALSLLLAAFTLASAAYLRQRGLPREWRAEIDGGVRPLSAAEAARPGDRIIAWEVSALGASVGKEVAFLFHDDDVTRNGNAVVLLCVVVPLWLPLAASLPIPAVWYAARRRDRIARVRAMGGACAACGYDLRATPGRCPECGAVHAGTA